jgi:uncharacterized Tic20 family protein
MKQSPEIDIEMRAENSDRGPVYRSSDPSGDNWAMACHLSALCGYLFPFGNVIGPLVLWLFKGKQISQVDQHGKEALNFQISVTLYMFASMLLMLIGIGVVLLVALSIFTLVMIIIATIKARNGELYHYPLTIRFIR